MKQCMRKYSVQESYKALIQPVYMTFVNNRIELHRISVMQSPIRHCSKSSKITKKKYVENTKWFQRCPIPDFNNNMKQ